MSDAAVRALAQQVGVDPSWRGFDGVWHEVAPDALRGVLNALGLPCASAAQIAESRAAAAQADQTPPLRTAVAGQPIELPGVAGRYRLVEDDGRVHEGVAEASAGGMRLPAVDRPGYHRLECGGTAITLAVAPQHCWQVSDSGGGHRLWGLAVQLYGLRRRGDGGLGDFQALAELVHAAAARGAAAVAISPVHAQFSADPDRFSPYAPSSRVALNVLHANPEEFGAPDPEAARLEALELVDWPAAGRARLRALRRAFVTFRAAAPETARNALGRFRTEGGDVLELHARFEAIHEARFGADKTQWHWRSWPAGLRDPASPDVAQFAQAHAESIDFHIFAQYLADRGLEAAQRAARAAGMPIGLIADLAVGTDSGGSHAWSRQSETLTGLTVGAPPDLLNTRGQNWGVTAFSPRGLVANGFSAFLEMLRAALRHAGGVRIDHAMGLARLWVVPDGAEATAGAYLRFPLEDLLRLVALESWRHKAVVLGEDLGTLPDGFRERLQDSGLAGMRVMWFERDGSRFVLPAHWYAGAVAMTTTHDLPTVSGWWQGRDLDWWERLGHDQTQARPHRAMERGQLWAAFRESGAAEHDTPPAEDAAGGESLADVAARHIGGSACDLALLPLEDALALPEQPNLPGTIDEHPNWRRRMPGPASSLLDAPRVAARLAALATLRGGPGVRQ
jgi:4-alpha-glucanotransferase